MLAQDEQILSSMNDVYLTNFRVIFDNPRLFGLKSDTTDMGYGDIQSVESHRGIWNTEIVIRPRHEIEPISLGKLGKGDAEIVASLIQRGIRGELQKQNITQHVEIVQSNENKQAQAQTQTLADLQKAIEWKEKGIISDSEFLQLKQKFFGGLS